MPEQSVKDQFPANEPGAKRGVAGDSECWKEYQTALNYLRGYGKEHPPTARLIILTMPGHEADAFQIAFDTGACVYAVNENLAALTEQGILVRRTLAAGRIRSNRYRINQNFLAAKLGLALNPGTRLERSDDAKS
jgi:hypothetical protein